MCERWPELLDQSPDEDVQPRLAQLEFLVREGKLTPAACLQLVLGHPRVLGHYTIRAIWSSQDLVAIDKPYDMRIDVPKGASPNWLEERTVADWFSTAHPGSRVRFCNQLDHATSGVLLMATSKAAGRLGSQLFEQRKTRKTYLALVKGHPTWEANTSVRLTHRLADGEGFARRVAAEGEPGEEAETEVRVLRCGRWPRRPLAGKTCLAALVEVKPVTGRRHQIRLHLSAAGVPILGDDTYGGNPWGDAAESYRMFLHALRLELPLPSGDATIEAPCSFDEELDDLGCMDCG